MYDILFNTPEFSATTFTVTAVSDAGKAFFAEMFGAGAVQIELPKSRGEDFAIFAERKGLKVA